MTTAVEGTLIGAILGSLVILVVFVSAILGTVVGLIVGWIIGITPLGDIVLATLHAAGMNGITMVNFGATMGFIAGFFSGGVNYKKG